MKHSYLFLIFLLATPLFATNETMVSKSNTNSPASTGSHETIEVKVLKAYVVDEGGAKFRAYLVMWKGHEVIAEDSLSESNYKEGDTVKVLAMRHPYPHGEKNYDLLGFAVLPIRPSRQ